MGERTNADLPLTESSSSGSVLFEIVDTDARPGDLTMTAEDLLRIMRKRVKVLGCGLWPVSRPRFVYQSRAGWTLGNGSIFASSSWRRGVRKRRGRRPARWR